MPPCAAVRMNEKSSPATPSRPTPSPEKVAQRVRIAAVYRCDAAAKAIVGASLRFGQPRGRLIDDTLPLQVALLGDHAGVVAPDEYHAPGGVAVEPHPQSV